MDAILMSALARMDREFVRETDVIAWGSPILSFGDPVASRVATLGLNPSNLEFADRRGNELDGADRRFKTLASLGVPTWTLADREHLERIRATYREYFKRNPYRRWFDPLDELIAGTGCSFYSDEHPACHLDLVPFATSVKWGTLDRDRRASLLEAGTELLGAIVRKSAIEVIVVNGAGVLSELRNMSDLRFDRLPIDAWSLVRPGGKFVSGFAYRGRVGRIGEVALGRSELVLGYNHNLQSTPGVMRIARSAIASWISREVRLA